MKSSRRKQTNPNRVAAGTVDTSSVVVPLLGDTPVKEDEAVDEIVNDMEESRSPQPLLTRCPSSDFELPLDMHVSTHTGSLCFDSFSRKSSPQEHEREFQGSLVKRPRLQAPGEDFPTAYHRLGRQLLEIKNEPLANGNLGDELSSTQILDSASQEHEAEFHESLMKRQRLQASGEDFPTAYHRLGRQLLEIKNETLANGHLGNEFSSAQLQDSTPSPKDMINSLSALLPASDKPEEQTVFSELSQAPTPISLKLNKDINGESVSGKTDRIFHMDAYCDLCDREFCNKYFLKTHKANKHGIYEDSSPPAGNLPLPYTGLMIPQDPLASFNFKMDSVKPPLSEPLLPWSFKLDSSSQAKKPEDTASMKSAASSVNMFPVSCTSSTTSAEPSLKMCPIPLPQMESPKPAVSKSSIISSSSSGGGMPRTSDIVSINTCNATTILTNITNSIKSEISSSGAPPANDSSMEDYCHICQKHFCNKYYLRKHKQDVHGIAPENPPSNSNKRSRSGLLDLPMTSTNHMMLPQPLVSLAGMHSLPGMHGMPIMSSISNMTNMHPGLMVINPYSLPPVAIIPAGSLMPGQQLAPPPHPMRSQSLGMNPMSEPNILSNPPQTSVSSMNGHASTHSPKSSPNVYEGGVHCNICAKEFCNEFYLQIHKESKHGIRKHNEEEPRDKAISLVKDKNTDNTSPQSVSHNARSESASMMPRSPFDRTPSAESNMFICNFCNKDFSNKYLYRIHRIHDHGMNELIDPTLVENGELPHREHILNSMNESLRMATDACFASSFENPPSNKTQESVVCEICNKQLTNQYFLRLHKFHVHGVDPNANEKYNTKPDNSLLMSVCRPKTPPTSGSFLNSSLSQQSLNLTSASGKQPLLSFLPPKMDFKDMPPYPDFSRDFKSFRDMPPFLVDSLGSDLFRRSHNQVMHMDLNFFGLPSLGKLPMDDSVKLNFDPEAYCEICKKEFCSKYFLRTHKQNIHGIKNDAIPSSNSKSSDGDKSSTLSPPKPNLNISNGKPLDSLDKNPWRWKEPINSSRVICDICNKEVCNKYFLRTHKQKKHGIIPTSQSPNVSMNGSPIACDCDTASNTSSQADEKPFKMDPLILPQMIPLPPTERLSEKFNMKHLHFGNGNSNKEISLNNNTEQCETCNICNRMFKNLKWLKEHIMKDHSNNEALNMSSKKSSSLFTCKVCGVDFPAELSVQLHLIQEHNARVTLDTEESQIPTEEANLPASEGNSTRVAELYGRWTLRKKVTNHQRLKKYVCNRCGFDSHWLSSLLDHERNEHGFISDEAPSYCCKSCRHLFPSLNSLSAHLISIHELNIDEALHEVKFAEPTFPNSYKCAHCPAVFPTRSWGMAHVRHVHIRSRKDLAVKNSFVKNVFRCSFCCFKTHFAFRLQQHIKCRHTTSSRPVYPSSRILKPSSASNLNFHKSYDVSSPDDTSREDSTLMSASSMYKSITVSLLSGPECDGVKTPTKALDTETLLLHNYKLPICSSPVDSASFKMALQTSASAVVSL
ncbi:unnamed protein product [Candidula unifasciata]|uniref:C2H2-type domain-containing protein n=1 Tax=Candidula unifasciata TaxID=100452 RepID=A0A8S3YCR2_9EUPU|nr:unnamed protein product [Candidula unifasciata]